ncbi:hypothetical protein DPEC_G00218320 [Dallia pectoralis]|uniref:Uncharacterized protein n=1 Tax=Dallia pectoralis TaxID=75939 RepID=A0ACC2G357_DALPE|nr:hypothetical protein DPEC_G00218320 [Dallia pectoralis]
MRQKRAYDQHTKGAHYQGGDLVWVYGPKRVKGRSPKLDSKWIGPCCVLEQVGEVVYRVKMAPRGRVMVLHRDRMAPYRGNAQPAYDRGTQSQSPASDQPTQGQPAATVRLPQGGHGGAALLVRQDYTGGHPGRKSRSSKGKGDVRGDGVGFQNGSGIMRLSS